MLMPMLIPIFLPIMVMCVIVMVVRVVHASPFQLMNTVKLFENRMRRNND
jgi:hypothetical protein